MDELWTENGWDAVDIDDAYFVIEDALEYMDEQGYLG